jgi:hypothetical protein
MLLADMAIFGLLAAGIDMDSTNLAKPEAGRLARRLAASMSHLESRTRPNARYAQC